MIALGAARFGRLPLVYPARALAAAARPAPVPAAWVHKARSENVLVEGLGQQGDVYAALLRPASEQATHFRRPALEQSDDHWSQLQVIEAVRQLAEAVCHRYWNVAPDAAFTIESIQLQRAAPVSSEHALNRHVGRECRHWLDPYEPSGHVTAPKRPPHCDKELLLSDT